MLFVLIRHPGVRQSRRHARFWRIVCIPDQLFSVYFCLADEFSHKSASLSPELAYYFCPRACSSGFCRDWCLYAWVFITGKLSFDVWLFSVTNMDFQSSNALSFIVNAFANSDGYESQVRAAQDGDHVHSVWKQLQDVQSDMEKLRTLVAVIETETDDGSKDS